MLDGEARADEWVGSTVQVPTGRPAALVAGAVVDIAGSLSGTVFSRIVEYSTIFGPWSGLRAAPSAAAMRELSSCPPPAPCPSSSARARAGRRRAQPRGDPLRGAAAGRRTGPGSITMDRLAAAAGVGKGTLFRHFGDRAGLFHALLDESERRLQEGFIRGPAPLGPGAPERERVDGVRPRAARADRRARRTAAGGDAPRPASSRYASRSSRPTAATSQCCSSRWSAPRARLPRRRAARGAGARSSSCTSSGGARRSPSSRGASRSWSPELPERLIRQLEWCHEHHRSRSLSTASRSTRGAAICAATRRSCANSTPSSWPSTA